jgi:hypothetical protein
LFAHWFPGRNVSPVGSGGACSAAQRSRLRGFSGDRFQFSAVRVFQSDFSCVSNGPEEGALGSVGFGLAIEIETESIRC